MTLLLQYTLIFAAVLMLVALGGCFSEHSGVINLGLEGIMVIGALGGALVMRYLPSGTSAFVTILLTLLAASRSVCSFLRCSPWRASTSRRIRPSSARR